MSSKRVAEAEAALESGRAIWEADKIEALKASEVLKVVIIVISQKVGVLNADLVALAAAQA